MINVAIMGHGVVGSGTAEILINSAEHIRSKTMEDVVVKYILDLRDFDGLSYSDRFTKDFQQILSDESVRIVVEVMGGLHPAYQYVKKCLEAGKSVVTSNKELVAAKGAELLRIAKEKNVNFLFEASVGGGIPIIRPMAQCLAANEITEIHGILNGTTNFILNKMIVSNMSFEDALALAQEMGYAERNPAADIEGHDACRKICILASLAFGRHVYPESVPTKGITEITLQDVENADTFGCVIKLIASAKKLPDGRIACEVKPMAVSKECILSGVNDVFNAVMIKGSHTGDVMFYGKGAGKFPTASAVVADVIDCVKHLNARKYLFWEDCKDGMIADRIDEQTRLLVSLQSHDFPTMLEQFKAAGFGEQTAHVVNQFEGQLTFLTQAGLESELMEKILSITAIHSRKILPTLF